MELNLNFLLREKGLNFPLCDPMDMGLLVTKCALSLSFSLFFPPFFITLLSLPLYSLSLSLSQNQIGERWQNCKSFFEYWIIIFNTIVRTHCWLPTAGSPNDSIPVEVFSIDWICWFCFRFYYPVWQLIKFYYDNFWLIDWLIVWCFTSLSQSSLNLICLIEWLYFRRCLHNHNLAMWDIKTRIILSHSRFNLKQ